MKRVVYFATAVVFAAVFSVSVMAQAGASKIVVIDSGRFADEKEGIVKFVAGLKQLNTEFGPRQKELEALGLKIQALEKEIVDLQAKLRDPNNKIPIPEATVAAKVDEYERLGRDYKFKEEDAKKSYQRRMETVLGPIQRDIGLAIQEFTKKNGYSIVFEAGRLDETGLLLGLDETSDVTKQFITFYNARPATTAATTTPK